MIFNRNFRVKIFLFVLISLLNQGCKTGGSWIGKSSAGSVISPKTTQQINSAKPQEPATNKVLLPLPLLSVVDRPSPPLVQRQDPPVQGQDPTKSPSVRQPPPLVSSTSIPKTNSPVEIPKQTEIKVSLSPPTNPKTETPTSENKTLSNTPNKIEIANSVVNNKNPDRVAGKQNEIKINWGELFMWYLLIGLLIACIIIAIEIYEEARFQRQREKADCDNKGGCGKEKCCSNKPKLKPKLKRKRRSR